ncbi:substrate-binding domain-containing protein [candidate division KSB1 bacterium]|nr:substrate-binding domain-containing protein [candidate division KSB1 bacterium]
MKKIFWLVVVIFGMCCVACQRGEQQSDDGRPTVALVMKTLNNPFFIEMQKGAQEAADRLGINLLLQAAEREVDVEKQMQIIENLIQRNVDAICVTPSGSKEIIPAIIKANKENIPVLIIDTRVDAAVLAEAGGRITTFIGSDNYEGGKVAGAYLGRVLAGSGKVAVLEGIPGHETGDQRLNGFTDAIGEFPGIEVVASQTANWERDQGFNVFQNILQSNPGVNALFACNDMMALGAIEAIAAAGKTGEITVIGFDAVADARAAIKQGTMSGSVAQFSSEMGRLAVDSAAKVLNGEEIPDYIPVAIELITQAKLAAIDSK